MISYKMYLKLKDDDNALLNLLVDFNEEEMYDEKLFKIMPLFKNKIDSMIKIICPEAIIKSVGLQEYFKDNVNSMKSEFLVIVNYELDKENLFYTSNLEVDDNE